MKIKNMTKKILSLILITILAMQHILDINPFRVQASDVTSPDNLTTWTISDVDMADGAYTSVENGKGVSSIATGETLDGKAFHTYATFPTDLGTGSAQLWIGGEYLNGIYFDVRQSLVYLKHFIRGGEVLLDTIRPAALGLDTLLGKKLEITLTTEFVNTSSDGTRTDVNIGLYINDNLYSNQYQLKDVPVDSLMQQVSVYTGSSGVKSILLEAAMMDSKDMGKWTINDVNMASGEYSYTNDTTGMSGTATGQTLDKTVFASGVTFPAGLSANQQAELWIGEQNNGFAIAVKGTTVYFKHASKNGIKNIATLSPSAFDLETLLGERLEVNLSVEYTNNNGTTTNANVGLYINGTLYNNQYFKVKDLPVDSLTQQICVFTRWAGGKKISLDDYFTPMDEFEQWTISDVGLTNGTYKTNTTSTKKESTATKKAFVANMKIPEFTSGQDFYLFVGPEWVHGVFLQIRPNRLDVGYYDKVYKSENGYKLLNLDSKKVGLDSFFGEDFKITVTTELTSVDETHTNVKVGIYFNDKFYGGFDLEGVSKSAFDTQIYMNSTSGAEIWIGTQVTKPSDLDVWNIGTVGITPGVTASGTTTGTATGNIQDGTVFRAKVTFPSRITTAGQSTTLWLGNGTYGYAFRARPEAGADNWEFWIKDETGYHLPGSVITIKPEDFDMTTSLVGQELDLVLTSELVHKQNGPTTAYVGIYINGNLYKGDYLEISNVSPNGVPQNVCVINNAGDKTIQLGISVTTPSELKVWDINTVGIPEGVTVSGTTTGNPTGNIQDGTAFRGKVTFPSEITTAGQSTTLWLGNVTNGNDTYGYAFRARPEAGADNLEFWIKDGTGYHLTGSVITITPGDFNLTTSLVGQELDLVLTSELVHNLGGTTTAYVGIYINGNLYKGDYLRISNVSPNGVSQNVHIINSAGDKSIQIGIPVIPQEIFADEFNQWTIEDVGMLSGEYSYMDDTTGVSGVATGATLDNTAFVTGVILPGDLELANQAELWIGEQNNGFSITAKGTTVYFKHTSSAGSKYISTLEPEVVGLKTLLGEGFVIKLTTEFVDSNGTTTDVKVGLYINGALYNDEYFILNDLPIDSLKKQVSVFTRWAGGKMIILDAPINLLIRGNVSSKSATANNSENGFLYTLTEAVYTRYLSVYSTSETAYKIYASDSKDTLFNEAYQLTYKEGHAYITLNKSVKYVAIMDSQTSNSQPEEIELSAVIFKGDMDRDGEVSSSDLTDVRQLLVSYDSENFYEELADCNSDRTINVLDLVHMKKYFAMVNAEKKVPSLTYEENVMPIVGFYGPTRVYDEKRGVSYDFITDDIYTKIKALGINLISLSADNYWIEDQRKNVLDSLAKAEQYGINMYVQDSRLSGPLSEEIIKLCMDAYDDYDSFKGIHVVDEPMSNAAWCEIADPDGEKPKLKGIGQIATRINAIKGMTGYVNLLPYRDYIGEVEYAKYMEEYIETCRPGFISFDYYPFDYGDVSNEDYFKNLSIARQKSLEYGIPLWTYIQAGKYWNDNAEDLDTRNIKNPTESQLLWNVNVSLAYGAKGVQYFPLLQPYWFAWATSGKYNYDRNGLIGANGEPTKWYAYAQKANKQVAAVDEVLLNAESKQVLAVGSTAQADTGLSMKPYGVLSSVQVGNSSKGAVIGCFDYKGKDAFYVVNYDTDEYNLTTNRTQTITLNFDGSQKYHIISEQLASGAKSGEASNCTVELIAGGSALIVIE